MATSNRTTETPQVAPIIAPNRADETYYRQRRQRALGKRRLARGKKLEAADYAAELNNLPPMPPLHTVSPNFGNMAVWQRRIMSHNARSNVRHSGLIISIDAVTDAFDRQTGLCRWCNEPLDASAEIDHIVPLVRGGLNEARNICLACHDCNADKRAQLPSEWLSNRNSGVMNNV